MEIIRPYIFNFFFIFLRAGIVVLLFPFFGAGTVPASFKIGLAAAIAIVLAPVIPPIGPSDAIPQLVIREAVFGMAIGGASRLVFYAVDMAGQMMSSAMGLSMASMFNPEIGQSTELAQLYGMITMLLFLTMNAHHDLIALFVKSYELSPSVHLDPGLLASFSIDTIGLLFVLALKLSAPVIVGMLITNLLLGFLAKTAPQMNVFFVGYPIYLFVGFLILLAGLPVFLYETGNSFGTVRDIVMKLIAGAGR